jgi:hypothetical protein
MNHSLKFKSIYPALLTTLLTLTATHAALAEDEGIIRAKAGISLANYTSPSASGDFKSNYFIYGLGVTYIFPERNFIDVTLRTTGNASYNAQDATANLVSADQPLQRTEGTLTVGMPFDNGLQGNAGLFTSNTVFKLAQFGQFSQTITGVSAGIGKGIAINEGKLGTLGFSGAFALLGASNTDRYGTTVSSNLSYGLSLGTVFNYMIDKNFGISADVKFQSYVIKYANFAGDERILSAGVALIAQF